MTVSYLKIGALVLNLVVMAYLLWAHRLFGFRGGGDADRACSSATAVGALWSGRRPSRAGTRP